MVTGCAPSCTESSTGVMRKLFTLAPAARVIVAGTVACVGSDEVSVMTKSFGKTAGMRSAQVTAASPSRNGAAGPIVIAGRSANDVAIRPSHSKASKYQRFGDILMQ